MEDVSDNSTLIWTSSNTSFSVRPIEAWRLLQSMAETIWKAGDGRGDAAKDLRIFAFEDGRLLRYSPGIETAFWGSLFKDVVSQNRYSRCILEFVFTSFLFPGALI